MYSLAMTSRGLKTRDEVEAELQAFAASRRSAERRLHAAQAAQMAQVRSHAQATARRVDDQVKRATKTTRGRVDPLRPCQECGSEQLCEPGCSVAPWNQRKPARASRPVTAPLASLMPKRDPLMAALERAYLGQTGSKEERAERRRGLARDRRGR